MDTFDALRTRRSIRTFTDAPVDDAAVETLLRAAMAAPSAGNQQPWQFAVLTERRLLDAIPEFHPHSAMLRGAPLGIVVAGRSDHERFGPYWVQDCAAATENLLLAAHASGLGATWCGIYPREERVAALRDLLGMPAEVAPFCVVAIGHPGEEKPAEDRYDPERVHRNGW